MEKNILYMRRIQNLIDRMKKETDMNYRSITYVAIKAIVGELIDTNPDNHSLNEKAGKILENLKWLAHIDHPGHDDQVYIGVIDSTVRELHAESRIIFTKSADEIMNKKATENTRSTSSDTSFPSSSYPI